jgi:hypothetical protein
LAGGGVRDDFNRWQITLKVLSRRFRVTQFCIPIKETNLVRSQF